MEIIIKPRGSQHVQTTEKNTLESIHIHLEVFFFVPDHVHWRLFEGKYPATMWCVYVCKGLKLKRHWYFFKEKLDRLNWNGTALSACWYSTSNCRLQRMQLWSGMQHVCDKPTVGSAIQTQEPALITNIPAILQYRALHTPTEPGQTNQASGLICAQIRVCTNSRSMSLQRSNNSIDPIFNTEMSSCPAIDPPFSQAGYYKTKRQPIVLFCCRPHIYHSSVVLGEDGNQTKEGDRGVRH